MHYKVSIVLVDETITKSAERRGRGGGGRQQPWLCASAGHRPPVKQARIETTRRLAGDNAGPALVLPGGAPPLRPPAPTAGPAPGKGLRGPASSPSLSAHRAGAGRAALGRLAPEKRRAAGARPEGWAPRRGNGAQAAPGRALRRGTRAVAAKGRR